MTPIQELKLFKLADQYIVHAPAGRGEELRLHLASHGIESRVSSLAEAPFDRMELAGDADPIIVQTILDQWER